MTDLYRQRREVRLMSTAPDIPPAICRRVPDAQVSFPAIWSNTFAAIAAMRIEGRASTPETNCRDYNSGGTIAPGRGAALKKKKKKKKNGHRDHARGPLAMTRDFVNSLLWHRGDLGRKGRIFRTHGRGARG